MKKFSKHLILVTALLGVYGFLHAEEVKRVMPAKQRAKIVALAQSIFEPQIKNSVKVGRVSSPFSAAPQQ